MRSGKSIQNPECPAIAELADALERAYPSVTLFTTNNVSPGTRHTAGLAIDIMLDVTKTEQRQLAHGIIGVLVRNWSQMKWSDLIYSDYDGRTISYFHIPAGGGYGGSNGMLRRSPYTQDTRHGDHIHLDWVDFKLKNTGTEYLRIPYKWSSAASTTGFAGALSAALSSPGSTTIEPMLNTMSTWLYGWWRVYDGNTYYYYFNKSSSVSYTKIEPKPGSQAMQNPLNRGTFSVAGIPERITIDWNPADGGVTREVFTGGGAASLRMNGTSNRYGPLVATKMV